VYRLLYPLTLFLLAGSLFAADPFAGTWKPNTAKSKFAGPDPAPLKEMTIVSEGGTETVTEKRTTANGSPLTIKWTFPTTGGLVQFLEGVPPGFSSVIAKRKADSRIADQTDMKDGKLVATYHAVVSADGKSIRAVIKAIDAQGKTSESVVVLDKQ